MWKNVISFRMWHRGFHHTIWFQHQIFWTSSARKNWALYQSPDVALSVVQRYMHSTIPFDKNCVTYMSVNIDYTYTSKYVWYLLTSSTISARFNRSKHLLNKITNKPCIAGYTEREIVCGDVDRFLPTQV